MRPAPSLRVLGLALGLCCTAGFVTACGGAASDAHGRDLTPTTHRLAHPLPAGVTETNLAVASAGASSGGSGGGSDEGRARAALTWHIAVDTQEYEYAVARCERLRVSESGEGGAIATAYCDDARYDVVVDGDRLELRRDGDVRTSFSLPANTRVRLTAAARDD